MCVCVIYSCQKEEFEIELTETFAKEKKTLAIAEVKNWFANQKKHHPINSLTTADSIIGALDVIPVWSLAKETYYLDSFPIVWVPIEPIEGIELDTYSSANLIFFEDSLQSIHTRLFVYHADPAFYRNLTPTSSNFTGMIYQVNEAGEIGHVVLTRNGIIIDYGDITLPNSGGANPRDGGPGGCYSFSDSFFKTLIDNVVDFGGDLWNAISRFFNSCSDGGSANNGNNSSFYINFLNIGGGFNFGSENPDLAYGGGSGGGGGNGGTTPPIDLNGYFGNTDILGIELYQAIATLDGSKGSHNIMLSTGLLFDMIISSCNISIDNIQNYASYFDLSASISDLAPCVQVIVNANSPQVIINNKYIELQNINGTLPFNTLSILTAYYYGLHDKSLFDQINIHYINFAIQYPDFTEIPCTDALFGSYEYCGEQEIPIVIVWILKKAAQAGAGALVDISIQLAMEYWLGGHSSWADAWKALDIDEIQVLSSAAEAMVGGKYASTIISAFSDLTNYLVTTPYEQISLEGIVSSSAFGAISGYLGGKASDYIGDVVKYFQKYGAEKPWQGLKALGIHPFFFNLRAFREEAIFHIWRDMADVPRGKMLEELLTYSRYKNYTWANAAREMNGPIDFHLNGLGVQLKTIKNANPHNNWSSIQQSVKNGLDQLKQVVNNGWNGMNFNNSRLDIMIPGEHEATLAALEIKIMDYLNEYNSINNLTLTFNVGFFDH